MTNKELQEELKKYPDDSLILCFSYDTRLTYELVDLDGLGHFIELNFQDNTIAL